MRESISNAYVFMIVLVIIGACAIIVISSLSYSKTYKIKNRMIEIIEKYGEYNESTENDIKEFLKTSGYPTLKNSSSFSCPKGRGPENVEGVDDSDHGYNAINTVDNYKYCVYRYKTVKGYYYSVVTYMSFDLPLIGDLISLEFPLYGDTKVFMNF
ncbi:MAG TPA: hypothetical protein PLV83_02100 [Bacilli bacterium]|nr:hypothetical protein [Bacilli bacterium]